MATALETGLPMTAHHALEGTYDQALMECLRQFMILHLRSNEICLVEVPAWDIIQASFVALILLQNEYVILFSYCSMQVLLPRRQQSHPLWAMCTRLLLSNRVSDSIQRVSTARILHHVGSCYSVPLWSWNLPVGE